MKFQMENAKKFINDFLYGFYFPLCVAIWVVLCYLFNLQNLGVFVILLVAGLILLNNKDVTPIIPLFTSVIFIVRDYSPLTTLPFIIAYAIVLACVIAHFILFPAKQFYFGKLFFPLSLVIMALFLGGTLSAYASIYKQGLPSAFAVGPAVLLIYLFFVNGINAPKNVDIQSYVALSIIIPTAFTGLELLFLRTSSVLPYPISQVSFGWGNVNNLGAMGLISLPLCAYFFVKTNKKLACFAVMAYLLLIIFCTKSEGCMGIALYSLPFLALFVFLASTKKERRIIGLITIIIAILLFIAGIIIVNVYSKTEILDFIDKATYGSSRAFIYEKAITLFKENPVLGVGLGFIDFSNYAPTNNTYNFHSTVLHVAATMGCFGLIAYAIYYYVQIKTLLSTPAPFNTFAFISFILFASYGLIDTCQFNVMPIVGCVTLLVTIAELQKNIAEETRLPLFDKTIRF